MKKPALNGRIGRLESIKAGVELNSWLNGRIGRLESKAGTGYAHVSLNGRIGRLEIANNLLL